MNNKPSVSKFVIPKKPRLDPQEPPPLAGPDPCSIVFSTKDEFAKVLSLITKNRTVDKDSLSEKNWRIMELTEVKMIRNPTLEKKFNAYKQRTGHTEEFWGYRVVHDIVEEASIVNEGLRAGLDMIPDIGDPAKGVIVYNSPSVAQADWLAFEGTSNQIIMFRTVRGRALEVKLDSGKVDPSPHHNCHVAFKAPFENDDINPASMIQEHRMGAVYHYEFVDGTGDFYKRPSMILPYAILKYKKKEEITRFSTDVKFLNCMRNSNWTSAGKHTIHLPNKSETVEVMLPSTRVECPEIILNFEANPVVQTMDDIKKYPILRSLRTTHFGKLITTDTVAFNTPIQAAKEGGNSATYVLLQTDNCFADALRNQGRFLVWEHYKWTIFYFPSGHAASEFGFSFKKDSLHVIIACKGITNGTHNQLIGPEEAEDLNWFIGDAWSEFENPPEFTPVMSVKELHPSILKQPGKGILRESNFRSKVTSRVTFNKESNLVQILVFDPFFEDEETDARVGALVVNPSMSFDDKRKQEQFNANNAIIQQGNNEMFRGAMMKTQSTRKGSEESEVLSVNLMNLHSSNVRVDPAPMNASMHRNSYENSEGPRPLGVPRHSVPPASLSLSQSHQFPPGIFPNGAALPPITGVPPPQHPITRHHLPDPRFGSTPLMTPAWPFPCGSPPVDYSRPPPPLRTVNIAPPTILPVVTLSSHVSPKQPQDNAEIGEAAMDLSFDDRDEENDKVDESNLVGIVESPEPHDVRHYSEDDQNEDGQDEEVNARKGGEEEPNDILAMAMTPAPRPEVVEKDARPPVSKEDIIAKALSQLTPTAVETIKNLQMQKQEQVKRVTLADTDLRIPAPTAIAFSINTSKPVVNLLKPLANVLGDDDDDEETERPGCSSWKSQDVDYRRRPSALAPKRSSTPEFSKDRDDRRKDIDERFSCIPLSCEVQESEKQRKIKDSFQEKLRETGKIRETIVQDNCMKFMNQGSFRQAPTEVAATSFESALNVNNWNFGDQGLQVVSAVENTQQSLPLVREPEPEPKQMRFPEKEVYQPITFMNQKPLASPVKTKEECPINQQQDAMSNVIRNRQEKSPRKQNRKPVDYDQTRGNKSHDRISEEWRKTLVKKDQKNIRSREVEEGEIESDDDRHKSKASDTSTSGSDIVVSEEVNYSPRTVQHKSGSQDGSSHKNVMPRNSQQPCRSFYDGIGSQKSFGISFGNSEEKYSGGHLRNLSTSSARSRADAPAHFSNSITYSIFVDHDLSDSSLKPADLKALFDKLAKLKRVPIQNRRFDGTVYVHKKVFRIMSEDQNKKKCFQTFHDYSRHYNLVEILTEHACDQTSAPKLEDFAECIRRTNEEKGGKEAFFVSQSYSAGSPFGRSLIRRNIRLISVQELDRYLDNYR